MFHVSYFFHRIPNLILFYSLLSSQSISNLQRASWVYGPPVPRGGRNAAPIVEWNARQLHDGYGCRVPRRRPGAWHPPWLIATLDRAMVQKYPLAFYRRSSSYEWLRCLWWRRQSSGRQNARAWRWRLELMSSSWQRWKSSWQIRR